MIEKIIHTAIIPESLVGKRLDSALSQMFPEYSRSRLQSWLKDGFILVNGLTKSNKWAVAGGEEVKIDAELKDETACEAENIDLKVAYIDDDLIIIDKPVGLVVHPAPGHRGGTLVNALLHHYPELVKLPRAGIVHRIDKDTSGLLLVARNITAHNYLVEKLQDRDISRTYYALCHGEMISGGTVNKPIGRHPTNRLKMAIVETAKAAVTHYRVAEKFVKYTLLKINLETGRTHQIRVHMESIGYPLVGDSLYSKYKNSEINLGLGRQALHAAELSFVHPTTGEIVTVNSELPTDFSSVIESLQKNQ